VKVFPTLDWRRWPPKHLEFPLHPNESCTADYLSAEYREAVEQFDDLRFQFVIENIEDDPEVYY
jgi:hypothetical protein